MAWSEWPSTLEGKVGTEEASIGGVAVADDLDGEADVEGAEGSDRSIGVVGVALSLDELDDDEGKEAMGVAVAGGTLAATGGADSATSNFAPPAPRGVSKGVCWCACTLLGCLSLAWKLACTQVSCLHTLRRDTRRCCLLGVRAV